MRGGRSLAALLVASAVSTGVARAADTDDGFFIFLDAALASPQNTDEVLGVTQSFGPTQTEGTIRTDFSSDTAFRLGLGYKWKGGQSVSVHYWKFDTDERTSADGPANGFLNFAVGPAPFYSGTYYTGYFGQFGQPGSLDITSKIEAESFDVTWGRDHELVENLVLGWSLGVRYAKFEETETGTYDYYGASSPYTGYFTYGVSKRNEGTMTGLKADLRVTRNFGSRFALTSGLGFSFLKGKVESSSGLTAIGLINSQFLSPTRATASDDDTGGLIRDFDVGCYWRLAGDHFRLGIGWEQSSWDGVPTDLLRNTTTSLLALEDRKNVTFTSWKLGLYGRF